MAVLTLENPDLEQLQTILNEIPFKHAYALFQFLTQKISAQNTESKVVKAQEEKVAS